MTRRTFASSLGMLTTATWAIAQEPAPKIAIPEAPGAKPVGPAVASDPEASRIFAAMARAYAEATSYEDDGEAVLIFRGAGQDRTVKQPFLIRYARPRLFRFEFSVLRGDGEGDGNRYVIWSDAAPDRAKTWWTIQPQVKEAEMFLALGAAGGVSARTSTIVPGLLGVRDVKGPGKLPLLKEIKLVGEDLVEGVACFKIEGKNYSNGPETVWIDKQSYLIRKMFNAIQIPGNIVEQTTTHRPRINVAIPAAEFHFEPPKP